MKFGVSTWLWVSPFNDRSIYLLEKVKLMGYDIIEIPIEDPKDIDTVKINRIKKRTRDRYYCLWGFWAWERPCQ